MEAAKLGAKATLGSAVKTVTGGLVMGTLFGANIAGIDANAKKIAYGRQYDREVAACKTLPH